jgi:hypothetical protein
MEAVEITWRRDNLQNFEHGLSEFCRTTLKFLMKLIFFDFVSVYDQIQQ